MASSILFLGLLSSTAFAGVPRDILSKRTICHPTQFTLNGQLYTVTCGVDRPGTNYNQTQTDSWDQCINACTADSQCATAQFHEDNGFCYFKNTIPSEDTAPGVDTIVRGSACEGGIQTLNGLQCNILCGVDYAGGNSATPEQQLGSVQACAEACASDSTCATAQYNEGNGYCYFKSSLTGATQVAGTDSILCSAGDDNSESSVPVVDASSTAPVAVPSSTSPAVVPGSTTSSTSVTVPSSTSPAVVPGSTTSSTPSAAAPNSSSPSSSAARPTSSSAAPGYGNGPGTSSSAAAGPKTTSSTSTKCTTTSTTSAKPATSTTSSAKPATTSTTSTLKPTTTAPAYVITSSVRTTLSTSTKCTTTTSKGATVTTPAYGSSGGKQYASCSKNTDCASGVCANKMCGPLGFGWPCRQSSDCSNKYCGLLGYCGF